jgi:hypothetical protein
MIRSEILQEKDKTQARLSEECSSIHDYLVKSHIAAEKVAELYGFSLRYAELPNLPLQRTPLRSAAERER